MLDSLAVALPIDKERIVIGGSSMGGYGTWDTIVRHPSRFAIAVPISGGGDTRRADLLGRMSIWAFHAANDTVVPVNGSRQMTSAVAAARSTKLETIWLDGGTTLEMRSADDRLRYTELGDDACLFNVPTERRRPPDAVHIFSSGAALSGQRVFKWVNQQLESVRNGSSRGGGEGSGAISNSETS